MNFSYGLPAALIGAAVVVVQPQLAVALTPPQVNSIAKEFTVRIGGDGIGSGVIFERKDNTYFVITNQHVVSEAGRYEIQTPDGSRYPVYYSQELPGLDLAVLQFTSNKNYRTANLGNSDQMREGMTVYVVGWASILAGDESSYQFTAGIIRSRRSNQDQGYDLVYSNEVIPGMSGGPVLDENARLVGINGIAKEVSKEETLLAVLRLGIPINTFLAARKNLPSPTATPTTAPQTGNRATTTPAQQPSNRERTATRKPSADSFISLGGSKANRGDYQGAIGDYNQALRINPNNPDAYSQRGFAHFQLKEYQAALKDFNQLVRLTPNNSVAYLALGLVRTALEDYQGAIEDLNQGIRLNPNNYLAYYARGVIRNTSGDTKGAIADFDQAIRLKPDDTDAYYERGNVRYKLKDYKGAIADYNLALSYLEYSGIGVRFGFGSNGENKGLLITEVFTNTPASKGGVNVGDQILAINGESTLNKSEEVLNQLIDNRIRSKAGTQVILQIRRKGRSDFNITLTKTQIINPKSAKVYNERGLVYANQGDNQRAIADYDQAIQRDSNYAHAYYNRGLIRRSLGDKPKALEDFQKAAVLYQQQEETDNYQDAQNRIRELQGTGAASQPASNQRDYQAEIAAANQAIKRNPNDSTAYFNRAVARYNQGDKQAALADFNQATRSNPRNSVAWYNRGFVLAQLGQNKEAIASYNRAIEANSAWGDISLADAYSNRAELRSDRGDYRGAIADFTEVIRLKPDYAVAYALRGLNYQRRGKNQEAIADFNQAARIDPNNAITYMVRGLTYHLQGDYQGALAAYETALDRDEKLLLAVNNIGLIKYELQDVEGAIRQWEAAIDIDSKSAEPQLALAVALYTKGDHQRSLAMAEAALRLDNRFADLEFLKKNLWGDRMLADAQKLLETSRIQATPSRSR